MESNRLGSITEQLLDVKSNEVGIDLDRCSDIAILITYFNARHLADSIQIYKSSSERGYHFILRFNRPLTVKERIKVREFLGDCTGRLFYSEGRGGDDVLFDIKTQGREWCSRREIPEETLISPYNSRKFGR